MNNQPTQYWGGEASTIGTVHRLPVNSWARFVKETLGHPAVLNVTREQFHAMPPKERNAAKRVRFVTPATFTSGKRDYAHVNGISLVILDIDDSAQARRLLEAGAIRTALAPHAFAAYTTASSQPDAPKLRVIVPAAQPFKPARYRDAVQRLGDLLGLDKVTSESKVSAQPMYLPTIFRNDDPLEQHPLFSAVLQGEGFTDAAYDASSPAQEDTTDELENLRLPMEGVTQRDVQEALTYLDADCSMADWIMVGFALRHQFGDDDGFDLWDEWSKRSKSKYDGESATAKRWKSLRETPRGRAPITIRTLFHKAQEAGWAGLTTLDVRAAEAFRSWMNDPNRSGNELLTQGLRKLIKTDLKTPMIQLQLLRDFHHRLKAVNPAAPTLPELKKELRRMATVASTRKQGSTEEETPPWAKGMTYVQDLDKFYHRASASAFDPQVLDRSFGRKLKTEDGKVPRASEYLLHQVQVPVVHNLTYDPTHPEDTFVELKGRRYINIYIPDYPEPDASQAREAQDVFEGHLHKLVGEGAYRRTLLDFLAFNVQHPGVKIRWAVLLQGAQGCGKTAIMEMMRAVLGPNNARVIDATTLFSQYNPWAMGSQLVGMEEIRVVGHNRHEVMNRLKPCISNDTVVVNRKYADLQHTKNVTNYMMFTNHHDSLAISLEDRRYFIVNSAIQTKAQVLALGAKYFDRLFGCIHDKAPGLRHWLQHHKISATFEPSGRAPETKYLGELAETASTPLTSAINEAIRDSRSPLIKSDLLSSRALNLALPEGAVPRYSHQQMALALRELGYTPCGRVRIDRSDDKHALWCKQDGPWANAHVQAEREFVQRSSGKKLL